MKFPHRMMICASLALFAWPVVGHTADLCEVKPGEKTITADEARAKMAAAGYTEIVKVEMEHGCLEGKGFKAGKKIEVYVHPVTGEIVKVKEK